MGISQRLSGDLESEAAVYSISSGDIAVVDSVASYKKEKVSSESES